VTGFFMKKLVLFCILLQLSQLNAARKTEYPMTHFFLNLIGPVCIIKGSSVQIPFIPFLHIKQKVNWNLIIAGIVLLATSRGLRILEKAADNKDDF